MQLYNYIQYVQLYNYIQHVQLYNYIQYVLFHIPQTKNQFFTFCGCRNENPNKITKTSKNVKN